MIAVKLWPPAPFDGDDAASASEVTADVLKEVALLGRLRHQNIVRLLGYVHNDMDAMILYEFMPNGSLWEALHGPPEKRALLDWEHGHPIARMRARRTPRRSRTMFILLP